jgi:hypothetical protein
MNWVYEARASTILYGYLQLLEPGYEFLIPANVCPIIPAVFHKARVPFRLVDISKDTFCINESLVSEILEREPSKKGLLYVRTFGRITQKTNWFDQLKLKYNDIRIIDDRCLCKPSMDHDIIADSVDLVLFSTGYAKYVEFGSGGYAYLSNEVFDKYKPRRDKYDISDHKTLIEKFNNSILNRLPFDYKESHWLDMSEHHETWHEYKSRIEIQMSKSQLQKEIINDIYSSEIPRDIWLGEDFNDWRFNILVDNKEKLLKKIFDAGLFASSHYASLSGIFDDERAPEADSLHSKIVNLFNDFRINQRQALFISKLVRRHINS